jgi:hypothetical protein
MLIALPLEVGLSLLEIRFGNAPSKKIHFVQVDLSNILIGSCNFNPGDPSINSGHGFLNPRISYYCLFS